MKRILLCVFTMFSFTAHINSQVAPDFTETDINGVEHNLYSYLEAGKTVILDVSATWCGPCWNLHSSHRLEYLNQTYGPIGTDDVVVIYFEGDPDTSSDELFGISGNTLGNWVEGTSYIFIDPAEVTSAFLDVYAPLGFPTVSVICPESKEILTDIYATPYAEYHNTISMCSPLTETAEIAILSSGGDMKNCEGKESQLQVSIANLGTAAAADVTVVASKDGVEIGEQTIEGVVSIDVEGAPNIVDFGLVNIEADPFGIIYNIKNSSDNPINDNSSQNFEKSPETTNEFVVHIETDQYAEDENSRWKVVNDLGENVIVGPTLLDNTTYDDIYTLPNVGCYTFIFEDDYGDGLLGTVTVTDSEGTVVVSSFDSGYLGAATEVSSISTSIEEFDNEVVLTLTPTLVNNQLNINVSGIDKVELKVLDILGNVVYQNRTMRSEQLLVNTSTYSSGVYFVSIKQKNKILTKKFSKI